MLFAHGRINTEPMADEQVERAERSDLLFGRVGKHVPLLRSLKPGILLFDYARPTVASSWTTWLKNYGDGSLPQGIKRWLDDSDADGVLLDTPFEGADPWANVKLIDEIQEAIHPRYALVNFGDFDTWAGRTSVAKALAAITDWQLAEVFLDINRYTITQFRTRVDAVARALYNGKRLILGVYDNGRLQPEKAASMMQNWPELVYWSYKISPNDWGFVV